jgi:ClpA/ClpB-like protein
VVTDDPWAEAYREARERRLGYIGTDLLLLGLARTTGVASEVLRELGATPDAISAAIDALGVRPPLRTRAASSTPMAARSGAST